MTYQSGIDDSPTDGTVDADVDNSSVTTEDVTLTEPAVYVKARDSNTVEPFLASDYADGGATIQAAIDSLPSNGGQVYIPPYGPDDGLTNGSGNTEDNAWAISSQIETSKRGVHIWGAGPGWTKNGGTGTALIATSGNSDGRIMIFRGGFLTSVRDMRLDAAGNINEIIATKDSGSPENDFQFLNLMVSHSNAQGIRLANNQNVWIHQCWVEFCGAAGIQTNNTDEVHISELLDNKNKHGLETAGTNNVSKIWLESSRIRQTSEHGVNIGDAVTGLWVRGNRFNSCGQASSNSFDAIHINDDLTAAYIDKNSIDGGSQTRYGINRAGGTMDDVLVQYNSIKNVASSATNGLSVSGLTQNSF